MKSFTGRGRSRGSASRVLAGTLLLFVVTLVAAVPNVAYSPYGYHLSPMDIVYLASGFVTNGIFLLGTLVFLRRSGRGRTYLDGRMPSAKGLLYAGSGVLGTILVSLGMGIIGQTLTIPVLQPTVLVPLLEDTIRGTLDRATVLGGTFVIFVFVAPPVEEVLFRNVIQKALSESYSPGIGIGIVSLLFALFHVPAYVSPFPLATGIALGGVLLLGVVYGVIYHRTQNVGAHPRPCTDECTRLWNRRC